MGGTCSTHVGKPEWKRTLGRPRSIWEDNIRMNLRETVRDVLDCSHMAQDSDQWKVIVNTAMKLRVP
jgi:hypothetical protein